MPHCLAQMKPEYHEYEQLNYYCRQAVVYRHSPLYVVDLSLEGDSSFVTAWPCGDEVAYT